MRQGRPRHGVLLLQRQVHQAVLSVLASKFAAGLHLLGEGVVLVQTLGLLGAERSIQRPKIVDPGVHGRASGREHALAELIMLRFDRLHLRASRSLALLLDVGRDRNRLQEVVILARGQGLEDAVLRQLRDLVDSPPGVL